MPRLRPVVLRYDGAMAWTHCTPLPSCAVIAVSGRDARTFLQGQLTNDLLGLERHPGMLAAYCNRQGRVLAILRLAADAEGVLIVLHRRLPATLIGQISQYVLRADVRFEDCSDRISVAGLIETGPDARGPPPAGAASGLTRMVANSRRMLLIGARATLDASLATVPPCSSTDWDRACIADGEPLVQPETAALWLPQMLNLDLLGAVSFNKGCYVGQEIIARAQHLGRIKRRMLRYVGPAHAALQPGHALFSGESLAAQVVAVTGDAGSTQCLAVVELRYCSDLLGVKPGGSEFVPADLPYSIPAPADDASD
jgi:folate-binding protein YgfZ